MSISNLSKIIEDAAWDYLEREEGITKSDVDFVMLDMGYSPVKPYKDSQPVKVIKLKDNFYSVEHPLYEGKNVSEQELKIMRYRYLSTRVNPFDGFIKSLQK